MKKSSIFIAAVLITVVLSSCGVSGISSSGKVSSETPSEMPSSQNVSSKIAELELQIDIADEIKKPTREIEANETRYTWTLGIRKTFENALPTVTAFEYPYFYYNIMLAKDEGKAKGGLDFGRYSIESKQNEHLGFFEFEAQSDVDEASCIIDDKYLVSSFCSTDENGYLVMNLVVFDMEKKTTEIVYTDYAGTVFSYIRPIGGEEIAIFYYAQEDSKDRILSQKIVRYNISTKETKTIFDGADMAWLGETSTRDIWAMDFYNQKIYLLLHQLIDGRMKTFLRTIDRDGEILSEIEIDVLNHYSKKEQTAYHLVVEGDYLFINYFNPYGQPPSAILKWDGNNYILLDNSDKIYHKELLTPNPVDDRYLYFTVFEDREADLFVFDLQLGTARTIKTDIDDMLTIDCDSFGNVLIGNNNGYVSDKLYLFEKENVLS